MVLHIVEALDESQKDNGRFCYFRKEFGSCGCFGKLQNYGFSSLSLDRMKSLIAAMKKTKSKSPYRQQDLSDRMARANNWGAPGFCFGTNLIQC